MRKIKELIWHCTATPEGREVSRAEIDRWHKARGWNGIGYHKVVHLDGSVSEGRPEGDIGAHVSGRNMDTIGYVYVGGTEHDVTVAKDTRTPAQKRTMIRLTKEAIARYKLEKVSGHRDYAAKACPSFDAAAEYMPFLRHKNGRDLSRSRIVQGASASTAAGLGVAGEGLTDIYNAASTVDAHFSAGSVVQTVLGIFILAGSLYALYARWDDADRPSLREIVRSL